jgi:hypothetical protein
MFNNNKPYNKYINSLPIQLFKTNKQQTIFKSNQTINKTINKPIVPPFDFANVVIIKNEVNMPNVVIKEIPFTLVNNTDVSNKDMVNIDNTQILNFKTNKVVILNNDFIDNDFNNNYFNNNDFNNNDFSKIDAALTYDFNFNLNLNDNIKVNDIIKLNNNKFSNNIIFNDINVESKYINNIKNKHINKIIHIYQEKYAYNTNVSGLGDFIRSCFFIIQFCKKYDFQLEIIINHPIAYFLNKYCDTYSPVHFPNSNKIVTLKHHNFIGCAFDNNNYIKGFNVTNQSIGIFCDYLSRQPVINGSVASYNIFLPYNNVSLQECIQVRSLFEPSREIYDYVEETLTKLSLIKKKYIILHIRAGDSYLTDNNKNINLNYFNVVENEISNILTKNKNSNFLMIADNNEIKKLLIGCFPSIKFLINDITHLGEGFKLERNKVKNTLLDFYLMSLSSFIYAFTCYNHGSGFSYWCSKMYNIPYLCKYIK